MRTVLALVAIGLFLVQMFWVTGALVVEAQGSSGVAWSAECSGGCYSVAWSPDGNYLAVGYDGGVRVYSRSGSVVWEDEVDGVVRAVAWGGGGRLAVGVDSPAGGGVLVYDSTGAFLWSGAADYQVFSVAWSDKGYLAVGSRGRVLVFDRYGSLLWSSSGYAGTFWSLDWNSNGDRLAGVTTEGVLVVFDEYGDRKLMRSLTTSLYSVAWSPDGNVIVLGTGNGRVLLYTSTGSEISEENVDPGSIVFSLDWSSDGDFFVAASFSSSLTGRITILSSDGRILWYRGTGGSRSVDWSPDGFRIAATASSSSNVVVYSLGKIQLNGPGGASYYVKGPVSTYFARLPSRGTATLILPPDTYEIGYQIQPPPDLLGNPENLKWITTVTVRPDETTKVDLPGEDAIPNLVIKGIAGLDVEISWLGGSYDVSFGSAGTWTAPAAPGTYTITVSMPPPENYVGPSTIRSTIRVTVDFGQDGVVDASDPSSLLGKMTVQGDPGARFTVVAGGSSRIFQIPSEGRIHVYVYPGPAMVVYRLDEPDLMIGDPRALSWAANVTLEAGSSTTIVLPTLDDALSTIILVGEPGTSVRISWTIDESNYWKDIRLEGGEKKVYASPGNYTIYYVVEPPHSGDYPWPKYEGSTTVSLAAGQMSRVEIPAPDQVYGKLVLTGAAGTQVRIVGNGGEYTLNLNGAQEVYLPPGVYQVTAQLEKPSNFIGSDQDLVITYNVTVIEGQEIPISIPAPGDFPLVRISAPPGSTITITGEGGSWSFAPQNGVLEARLAPGSYDVVISYESTFRAGELSYSVNAEVGKEVNIQASVADFPYTTAFYGAIAAALAAVAMGSLFSYNTWIKPNPYVRVGEAYMMTTGDLYIELKVGNKGRRKWRGMVRVRTEAGEESVEVEVDGKDVKTVRLWVSPREES